MLCGENKVNIIETITALKPFECDDEIRHYGCQMYKYGVSQVRLDLNAIYFVEFPQQFVILSHFDREDHELLFAKFHFIQKFKIFDVKFM